jgi:hypothetical protein
MTAKNRAAPSWVTVPGPCRIIPFPGTAAATPDRRDLESRLSFAEHREAFRGVDFGGNPTRGRIVSALWSLNIHSLEELAKPASLEKLRERRNMGPKTLARIRAALESNGIASEVWGIPETTGTRQEN